ncbi:hypothetical protein D1007_20679 [Hordeum vulgare]|nr:hypothetical protein D1007_20679 [Hordeum vulgare]
MFQDPEGAEEEAPQEILVHRKKKKFMGYAMKSAPKTAAATRMAAESAEAEAARSRPPPILQLRTQAEKMAFLVSTVQGMEKNFQEIMQNQKSLERVVETKSHNIDLKVTELTTIVRQLQHEVESLEIPR